MTTKSICQNTPGHALKQVCNDNLLERFFPNKLKHNTKVQKHRLVLIWVIEVLKLIGKVGTSYRGKKFENAAKQGKCLPG